VDLDVFEKMVLPDYTKPHAVYFPESVNFRLKEKSKAIDAAIHLPNINDGFSGKAPDLGALEYGAADQIYGPRN